MALLEVHDLKVVFRGDAGTNHAVDGVSLSVDKGRVLGIVGESGCGKSVTAMSILRLVPEPPGSIAGGRILWKGEDLLKRHYRDMASVRGREIAMIFQDPMTSLNPVYTIGRTMTEVIRHHFGGTAAAALQRAEKALSEVGIADANTRLSQYPHELSGGMKQRVLIAMALLCEPQLLVADEPTTALDVTIQKQILWLMRDMKQRLNMAMILITHSLGVVAETCDEVAVMYAGRVVEHADILTIFDHPAHPYTRGLIDSIPKPGADRSRPLATIEGTVPQLFTPPVGCRFADRCAHVQDRCRIEDPQLRTVAPGQQVACHFPLTGARG